jgi:hypothetical protein
MDTPVLIENELQRKPPRETQNRGGTWGALQPFLIFLLPHVWIAVIAPFVLVFIILDAIAAEPFPGQVTEHRTYVSRKGGTTQSISAEFKVGDKVYKANENVNQERYQSIHDGDPITVYALRTAPSFSPRFESNAQGAWGIVAFATFWTVTWCSITFSIVWVVISQPLRSRYLVKNGIAVTGKLNSVREDRSRNRITYKALYTYEAKQTDSKTGRVSFKTFEGKMAIPRAQYPSASESIGKSLTILIDEKNPKRSIIYQFCNHVAIL